MRANILVISKKIVVLIRKMKQHSINKKKIVQSVNKLIADKDAVRAYIKGKLPLKSLTDKGIKLAKPL
jgi:hypothetical protein